MKTNKRNVGTDNYVMIPRKKSSYSISEVANMFNVDIWTIRLWANRFDILKPYRNKKDDIIFTLTDLDKIGIICNLTKKKGTKLEEVRKHLQSGIMKVNA